MKQEHIQEIEELISSGRIGTSKIEALKTLLEENTDLLKALKDLLEWGRTHTSPADPNSPHQLLIQACEAITKATGSC